MKNIDFKNIRKNIVTILAGIPEVEKGIIFGSFARETHDAESDIDLLVIGRFKGRILERRLFFYREMRDANKKVGLDIMPLTDEEVKILIAKGSVFLKEVLSKGKTIYERIH